MTLFYSPTIAKIATALAKAQSEMSKALTSSENPHFKSKYADLSSCLEAALPALNENGIALTQLPGHGEAGMVTLTTILTHTSGEYIGSESGMTPQKAGPHGHGSTLTYLRRYSLAAITGLSQADDDGNNAQASLKVIDSSATEAVLTAASKLGMAALKEAWDSADNTHRQQIANSKAEWWEGLKATATDIDEASA